MSLYEAFKTLFMLYGLACLACIMVSLQRMEREWRTLLRAYLEKKAGEPLPRTDEESEPGTVHMPIEEERE